MEQGDNNQQGRYMSPFFLFCGVLRYRVCLKSFWKVMLTEGMNISLQDEHHLAAHPEEWPQSNVCITLVDISLSLPFTLLPHMHLAWLALAA